MKNRWPRIVLSLVLFSFSLATWSRGQGALNPSGAPAPTFKTLTEVEPRIPINSTTAPGSGGNTFRIVQPGSYYLTNHIVGEYGKNGIQIASDDVTLDLMGFSLVGVSNALSGISVGGQPSNVRVHNGTIKNWPGYGISLAVGIGSVAKVENIHMAGNGQGLAITSGGAVVKDCTAFGNLGIGISTGPGALVAGCSVYTNTAGIKTGEGSTVVDCVAMNNTGTGIEVGKDCTVKNCTVRNNGKTYGWGIQAGDGCTILGCTVTGNSESFANATPGGISAAYFCTIKDCTVSDNAGAGIRVIDDNTISGCTVTLNTTAGIRAGYRNLVLHNECNSNGPGAHTGSGILITGEGNRIDSNNMGNNDTGMTVTSGNNLIIRNSANGNVTPYSFAAGNIWASPTVTGANISGNTNPHANYSY